MQPTNKRLVTESSVGGHVQTHITSPGATKTALDNAYAPAGLSTTKLDKTEAAATYITAAEAISPPSRRVAPPRATPITRFQPGHGWVKAGVGTVNLNNTVSPPLGTQYVTLTSNGAGGGLFLDKVGGAAMDLTNAIFAVLVRISDTTTKLSGFSFYAGTSAFANYEFMQAAGIQDINPGEWTWQHFSWADVAGTAGTLPRNAVTDLRFRIADNNTGTPVTVDIAALDIIPKNATYPNGVLTFGIDDGYVSAITKVAPILDVKGWAATLYPIVSVIGNTGVMTLQQISDLYKYHRWAIGGHAYDATFHQTGLGMTGGTLAAAEADMLAMRKWLLSNGFGSPDFFAWPQGISNPGLEAVAAKYWSTARGVNSTLQSTVPPDRPMKRHSIPVTATTTTASITTAITKAYAAGTWVDLIIHDVVDSAPTANQITVATLQAIVDHAATVGIPVRTTNDVMQAMA